MRTAIIILGGFVLLAACLGGGRLVGGGGASAIGLAVKVFAVLWFAVSAINMWVGVARAGYSFAEELPIFLLIFSVPAAVAAYVYWKFA
jgi:hypothetical protein